MDTGRDHMLDRHLGGWQWQVSAAARRVCVRTGSPLSSHYCNRRMPRGVLTGRGGEIALQPERQSCLPCLEGGFGDEKSIDALSDTLVRRARTCRVRGDGCRDAGLFPRTRSAHGEACITESRHLLARAWIPDAAVGTTRKRKAPQKESAGRSAAATALPQISPGARGHGCGPPA